MNKIITLFSFFIFLSAHSISAQTPITPDQPSTPHATIEFEQDMFNFGTIVQGEKVKNVFVFTNTSEVPLVIANAKGSCGCTVPEWPREPIMPGESSQLLVVFDSKGKKGNVAKKVTITANTEIANSFLTLKGTIELPNKDEKKIPKNRAIDDAFFNIYPNPTSDYLNIELEDYTGEKANIEIFDRSGKLVTSKSIDRIENKSYRIDLSQYDSGIYTATIIVRDKMRLAKQFVLQ